MLIVGFGKAQDLLDSVKINYLPEHTELYFDSYQKGSSRPRP